MGTSVCLSMSTFIDLVLLMHACCIIIVIDILMYIRWEPENEIRFWFRYGFIASASIWVALFPLFPFTFTLSSFPSTQQRYQYQTIFLFLHAWIGYWKDMEFIYQYGQKSFSDIKWYRMIGSTRKNLFREGISNSMDIISMKLYRK